jgi:hypothetical protein
VLDVPLSASFGAPAIGTSATQTITLTAAKTNGTAITIYSVTVVGPNAGDFVVQSSQCANLASGLAAGASCAVTVAFTPSQSGPRAAMLEINSGSADTYQMVSLMGGDLSGLAVTFSASSLNFIAIAQQQLTLTNLGIASLTADFAIEGTGFSVTPASANIAAGGGQATVTVAYSESLEPRFASLQISFPSVAGSVPQIVPLSGSGLITKPRPGL